MTTSLPSADQMENWQRSASDGHLHLRQRIAVAVRDTVYQYWCPACAERYAVAGAPIPPPQLADPTPPTASPDPDLPGGD